MLKKIKYNKYFLLGSVLVLILIGISFFQFYYENFSYVSDYNKIKEYCYEEKNPEHEYCKMFKNEKSLNSYIQISDPYKLYKKYDAITLTSEIVRHTIFNTLQYFSPLIISLIVIGTVHNFFTSGMFENYLLRIKYKDYLKKNYKIAVKSALIMPISLILIFIISYILSGFNLDLSNVDTSLSVYNKWKYDNFFLYGFIICLIQFFISLLYANTALCCCKQNKNKIVAIIMSFIAFIVIDIVVYIGIYIIFLNKFLGIKELSDYFNIAGYWFFDEGSNLLIPLVISFLLQLISFIFVVKFFKKKEQVVLAYEKQIS